MSVSLTFGQPLSQADLGQMYCQQRHLLVKHGTTSGQADFWSYVSPRWRHLVAKCGTTSGQVDLWSDVPPQRGM